MSCFIVNPRTVARIANYIAAQINMGFNYTGLYLDLPENYVAHVTKAGRADEVEIYKRLYGINYMGYEARYGDRGKEELDDCLALMEKFDEYDNRIDQPRNGKAEPWQYQMLKSMQCFLYQCDESDEVRDTESFKVVKMMIAALKDYIVSHLPEYQAAEWD